MKYTTTDELEHFSFTETYIADVQVTGGFLKRTDAFMFSIWFFTLYAMLNSMVFYSGNLAEKVIRDCGGYLEGKKRMLPYLILLLLVYGVAVLFYRNQQFLDRDRKSVV